MARFFLADLRTGRQIQDLPVVDGSWSIRLNDSGSLECTLDMQDPGVRALDIANTSAPCKTVLAVAEGSRLVEAGPIWARQYDRDAQTVSLSAKGMWSYFDHRMVEPVVARTTPVTQFTVLDPSDAGGTKTMPNPALATNLTALSLATIAKRLVAQAQAWTGGNVPVILPSDEASVNERHYEGAEFKNLGDAVRQLTQVQNGPDIIFEPRLTADRLGIEWVMRTGTVADPLLHSNATPHWDLDVPESTITKLQISEDGTDIATLGWATGGRADDTVLIARSDDTTLTDGGYALFETLDSSHSDVVDQNTLNAYANELTLYGRGPVEVWSFESEVYGQPGFDDYGLGDFIELQVNGDTPGYTLPATADTPATVVPPVAGDGFIRAGVHRQRIIALSGNAAGNTVAVHCAPSR